MHQKSIAAGAPPPDSASGAHKAPRKIIVWISKVLFHQMLPLLFEMHQTRWRLGLRPRSHWSSLQRSPWKFGSIITNLVNLSLSEGIFPSSFKQALGQPFLKKPSLSADDLNNFRPISNLNFISKIL